MDRKSSKSCAEVAFAGFEWTMQGVRRQHCASVRSPQSSTTNATQVRTCFSGGSNAHGSSKDTFFSRNCVQVPRPRVRDGRSPPLTTQEQDDNSRESARLHVDKKSSNVEPGPSTSTGTPKKRREDDLNEFIEIEDTEESRRSDLRNDDTWMRCRENNEQMGRSRERILNDKQATKAEPYNHQYTMTMSPIHHHSTDAHNHDLRAKTPSR